MSASNDESDQPEPAPFVYDLPVSGQGGLQPGVSLDSSSDLLDRMEDEF